MLACAAMPENARASARRVAARKAGMFKPWWDVAMLATESQQVVWLRFLRLAAGGPTAPAEARRMVAEKLAVATQAAVGIMTGESSSRVVARYRKKVRANRRRLMK